MSQKILLTEILAAHADQLLKRDGCSLDYLSLFPNDRELPPLLTLADHVKAALEPVDPDPDFKHKLRQDLLAAYAKKLEKPTAPSSYPSLYPTIFGALIAVIGLFIVFWHHQTQNLSKSSN